MINIISEIVWQILNWLLDRLAKLWGIFLQKVLGWATEEEIARINRFAYMFPIVQTLAVIILTVIFLIPSGAIKDAVIINAVFLGLYINWFVEFFDKVLPRIAPKKAPAMKKVGRIER